MPGIVLSTGYMPIIKNHSVFKIFLNIPYVLCEHFFYILLSSIEKQKENKYISNIMSIKNRLTKKNKAWRRDGENLSVPF